MRSILLLALALAVANLSSALTPFQLKLKFSKLPCEPQNGHEPKSCYDFDKKELIHPDDCEKKQNMHCAIYNCTCILRGGGDPRATIPPEYVMQSIPPLPAKKQAIALRILDGCEALLPLTCINSPVKKPLVKPTGNKTLGKRPVRTRPPGSRPPVRTTTMKPPVKTPTANRPVVRKPPVKRPVVRKPLVKEPVVKKPPAKRPTIKKPPVKKPAAKKPPVKRLTIKNPPVKKPAAKKPPVKKPHVKKPPRKKPPVKKPLSKKPGPKRPPPRRTTTTKKPSTKKPCATTKKPKKPAFTFSFFSRLTSVLNTIGFNSQVVATEDC